MIAFNICIEELACVLAYRSILFLSLFGGVCSQGCADGTWMKDYGCEDNSAYLDAFGFPCNAWNNDCLGASAIWNYTPEQEAEVIDNCPMACGMCSCEDTAGFFDAFGFACTDWSSNCVGAVDAYGYTAEAEADVIKHCPFSCGICTCQTSCFENHTLLRETQHIREWNAEYNVSVNLMFGGWWSWFSVDLVNDIFKIFASELLGVTVKQETGNFMTLDSLDNYSLVALEVWPEPYALMLSLSNAYEIHEMGYNGKQGLYFGGVRYSTCAEYDAGCVECSLADKQSDRCAGMSDGFEWFRVHDAARARSFFPAIGTIAPLEENLTRHSPNYGISQVSTELNAGQFPRYVSQRCFRDNSPPCMELLSTMEDIEGLGLTKLYQLVDKSEFPYHVLTTDRETLVQIVTERASHGAGSVFAWWEPDPFVSRVNATAVAFPFKYSSCADPATGYGMTIGCDRPLIPLKIMFTSSVRELAPELFFALSGRFRISESQIFDMMRSHVQGGGSIASTQQVACNWLHARVNYVRQWLPGCGPGTRPIMSIDGRLSCCNGTVRRLEGLLHCIPTCDPVNEAPNMWLVRCNRRCSAGSALSQGHASSPTCTPCLAGTHWKEVSDPHYTGVTSICQSCTAGEYGAVSQATSCLLCPPGNYSLSREAWNCTACPPGTFASDWGSSLCAACDIGTFQVLSGQSTCDSCPRGFVSDRTGTSSCLQCPFGKTTRDMRTTNAEMCLCPRGTYKATTNMCDACPDGMICRWGDAAFSSSSFGAGNRSFGNFPQVKAGFWTDPLDPMSVYQCADVKDVACIGGVPGSCAEGGRFGFLCEYCPYGHIASGSECEVCSAWNIASLPLLVIVGCPCLVMAYYKGNSQLLVNSTVDLVMAATVGMAVTIFQVLGMFRYLSIPWRRSETSQSILLPGSAFVAGLQAFGLECIVGRDPVIQYALLVSQPFVIAIFMSGCYMLSRILKACYRCHKRWEWNKTLNTMGSVYTAIFITLAAICASPAQLFRHPNGAHSVIRYPEVLVGDDAFRAQAVLALCLACLFLVPYVSSCIWGVRAVAGHVPKSEDGLWFKRTLSLRQGTSAHLRFRFLVYRFRPSVWWWGNVLLLRQLSLAFAPALPAEEPHAQAILVSCILTSYAVLAAMYYPWKSKVLNVTDLTLCLALSTFIVTSTSFMEPSSNLRTCYTWIMLAAVAIMVTSLTGAVVVTLVTMCRYGLLAAAEEQIPTQGPPKDLPHLWSRLCAICASLPPERLHELVCRMSCFDWNALEQSAGAWHALAPNVFPASAVSKHRLIGLEHSLFLRDGRSTMELVDDMKSTWSNIEISGAITLPSSSIAGVITLPSSSVTDQRVGGSSSVAHSDAVPGAFNHKASVTNVKVFEL